MRKLLILISAISLLSSCTTIKESDKTQQIQEMDTLAVFQPFVLCGEIADKDIFRKLRDSLFNLNISKEIYKRNYLYERTIRTECLVDYSKWLNKQSCTLLQKMRVEDSLGLIRNIREIEQKIHDSTMISITISSDFRRILSQNKYNKFLITDFVEYYQKGHIISHRSLDLLSKTYAIISYRVFIVDLSKNKIIYYNKKLFPFATACKRMPTGIWNVVLKPYFKLQTKNFYLKKWRKVIYTHSPTISQ